MQQKIYNIIEQGCHKSATLKRNGDLVLGIEFNSDMLDEMVEKIIELIEDE